MKTEDNIFFANHKGLYFYFFIWDESKNSVQFVYILFYISKKEDEHLTYFTNRFYADNVEQFDPYFKEWIKFVNKEIQRMEFFDRWNYAISRKRNIDIKKDLTSQTTYLQYLELISNFLGHDIKYLKRKFFINGKIKKKHIKELAFNYNEEITFEDAENCFDRFKHLPEFILLNFIFTHCKPTNLKGVPEDFIKEFVDNLGEIYNNQINKEKVEGDSFDDNKRPFPSNSITNATKSETKIEITNFEINAFDWLGNQTIKDTQLELIYLKLTEEYRVLETTLSCFKKAFSGDIIKSDELLKIKIKLIGRNKKSNLSAILALLFHLGNLGLIDIYGLKIDNSFYKRFIKVFSKSEGGIFDKDDLKSSKRYLKERMVDFGHLSDQTLEILHSIDKLFPENLQTFEERKKNLLITELSSDEFLKLI